MSEVEIQICNGISEMPVANMNALKSVCGCCPYGYHIDLDFVRFCETVAKNSGEPSPGKRQRRERRRQRQSMEVLLGLTNPVIWKIEQLLPPIVQENSNHEIHSAPVNISPFNYDNDGLKKAVLDFEATLERTSKRKGKIADSDSFKECRPDRQNQMLKTNENFKPASRSQSMSLIDFDLMTICSNGNSLTTSPLQNIREQMAISLERMRELEEKVKTIPGLEFELHSLKKENSYLQTRLENMKKTLKATENNLEYLRKAENETEFSCNEKPLMINAGITCSVITRDVGTIPVTKKFRDNSTETILRSSFIDGDDAKNAVTLKYKTTYIQAQPVTNNKSTLTDLYMSDMANLTDTKIKRFSLKDLDTDSDVRRLPVKASKGVQASVKESVNLLRVVEKREIGVQITEHKQMKETGIVAKPKTFDAAMETKPRTREIGVSLDKIIDFLCDHCKNLKTRSIGVGSADIRSIEADNLSPPERSKSFHLPGMEKLTRNIAVGTITPIRKLTSTKNVDTQDFAVLRSKHIGMNTITLHLVDKGVGSDSNVETIDTSVCARCNNDKKISAKSGISQKENKDSHTKDFQRSKIPRPKSLNTTPIMERKKFVRQDTYTKPITIGSPTFDLSKKAKQRVNLNSDKSESHTDDKVEVIRRSKTKSVEQSSAKAENLHKDLKDLQLEEGSLSYNRQFDDCCYDYDESYGDQDSGRNSQLFPDNVLFQPIQDEPREKIKPSKEMKAAMKVVNDSLSKYPGGLPRHLKNASNILQQEWFKVSSTASANPLDVEDYLDNFEEISSTLLEYIVNMVDNNGNTAMHYAVSHGNFDVVSILLDSKVCNINKPNAAGYTCIMLVSLAQVRSETHRQVVRRLFQLADVNIRAKQHGQTALMLAVSHGRLDMVKLLLEAGADPNIQDGDGSTALMCAAEHGHLEIVKQLLAHPDCDPSIVDCDGSTALAIAMEAGNRDIGVLLYAREHFASGSRGSSPYTSVRQRRSKTSSSPHSRTPTSPNPNRRSDYSL